MSNKHLIELKACLLLAILSFLLLQLSVFIYPGEYDFFGNTISTLSAIEVNGKPNFYSAVSLPLSHTMLAASICILSIRVKDFYVDHKTQYQGLIRASAFFGLIGSASIVIAAITPHGLPEPTGVIHRTFGIFMFPAFLLFAISVLMLNYGTKGISSPQTLTPIVLTGVFVVITALIYLASEYQWLEGLRWLPALQKIGYYLFILGIILMVWFLHAELVQNNNDTNL